MSRFLIICLSALFCTSFATAKVTRKFVYQIKKAETYDTYDESSKTFDKGDVYLYEINDDENLFGPSYEIEDGSGELSERFDMGQHNTIVTDDKLAVRFINTIVFIFPLDGNNVAFYQDLMPLQDFDHEFPVTRFGRGGETLKGVFAVNAKENKTNDWILAAVDRSGPRLIFPARYVTWKQEFEDIDKTVSFVVEVGPNVKEMTVEFQYSGVAKTFHAFVDSRRIPIPRP